MIGLYTPPPSPYALTVMASLELTTADLFIGEAKAEIVAATREPKALPHIDAAIAALVRARGIICGESVGPVPGACRADVSARGE